jgi:CDP-6-deoxy-D-xylo-4-hexulose-3-dehydrase
MEKAEILGQIKDLIKQWYSEGNKAVVPIGQRRLRIGGPIYDHNEVSNVIESLLSGWITIGPQVEKFENNFAKYCQVKYGVSVNSGSSANLIALSVLLDDSLSNQERIFPGDEVIVPATTFPTTATPIIQIGAVPVFVDVDPKTYNIIPELIEKAITDKTKAVIPVHLFGHPADMDPIMEISEKNNLTVIEDAAEAHGAKYKGRKVGSIGDMGTFSFFVAHHLTTSEGGMIITKKGKYSTMSRSLRAFGRACVCQVCDIIHDPDAFCPPRMKTNDAILKNYDIRQLFLHLGYSVKMTEFQAAFGNAQLEKLDEFIKARRNNSILLNELLAPFTDYIQLPFEKKWAFHTFYGYPILVDPNAPFGRKDLVDHLEKNKIETRPFFGGSLPDQPAFRDKNIRVHSIPNATLIRDYGFFIGCHPGISEADIEYIGGVFADFFKEYQ